MIHSVCNYIACTYNYKKSTKYDIHIPGELKSQYNSITNLNKRTPLYMIKLTDDNQTNAIKLKECIASLHTAVSAVSDSGDDSIYQTKKAYSEQDRLVSVHIEENTNEIPESFSIKVDSLACRQINESIEVYGGSKAIKAGCYHFTLEKDNNLYEFKFNVPDDTKNRQFMYTLADCINNYDTGVSASVQRNETNDTLKLILESDTTGTNSNHIFFLNDTHAPYDRSGIVEHYDLNRVTTLPQNAVFEVNGVRSVSKSNNFILNNTFGIELRGTTVNPIKIITSSDDEKVLENTSQFINAYNGLIDLAHRSTWNLQMSKKMILHLESAIKSQYNQLESCGIIPDKNKRLCLDKSLALQAARNGDIEKLFSSDSELTKNLLDKIEYISMNPIEYLDKTVVIYPNTSIPGTANSYLTSAYTGMLFDYFC